MFLLISKICQSNNKQLHKWTEAKHSIWFGQCQWIMAQKKKIDDMCHLHKCLRCPLYSALRKPVCSNSPPPAQSWKTKQRRKKVHVRKDNGKCSDGSFVFLLQLNTETNKILFKKKKMSIVSKILHLKWVCFSGKLENETASTSFGGVDNRAD